jgi:hypothetical protein
MISETDNQIIPATDPGETLATAYDLGTISQTLTVDGFVSSLDETDIFQLTVTRPGVYSIGLQNLIADGDIELFNSSGESLGSSLNADDADESIDINLTPGDYFISVDLFDNVGTTYDLSIAIPNTDAGNTIDTARQLGSFSSLNFTVNAAVGVNDTIDFYEFSVDRSGIFTADLSNLSSFADIRLIDDANNNGEINQGEIIAWQWEGGSNSESIRAFLEAGDYLVEVRNLSDGSTSYNVEANFTGAAVDPQAFDIQITLDDSLNPTQPLLNALEDAAQFWENVITHSDFTGGHTLNITVGGEELDNPNTIAQAGPTELDVNNLPITGEATINTSPDNLNRLNTPEFFTRILIHEFGHVLGIGRGLWEFNDLIDLDPVNPTYNANTYAGNAYGELLGTFEPTAIPLTIGEGEGSDFSHWREGLFGNEILTNEAENPGDLHPLSQLTIATLRDLGWNVNFGAAEPYSLPDPIV